MPLITLLLPTKIPLKMSKNHKKIRTADLGRLKTLARKDTILLSRSNTPELVGASTYISKTYPNRFLPDKLWQITAHPKKSHAHWLAQILASRALRSKMSAACSGSSMSMKNISQKSFVNIQIPLPPLPEQKKIAAILSTWNRAIEAQQALIKAKTERKRGLMQQLLSGKKRLSGFKGKWKYKQLGKVFERVNEKAVDYSGPVLSLTAGTGFVDQSKKWSRDIAGKNIENYILLKRGEFSYNKGNSKRYAQGCIYRLEEFDDGAVPNVWYSFRLTLPECAPLFYKHFFLAGGLNHQLSRVINAGVRNDGLLNLTAANFFSVKVPIPTLEEQNKIGRLLDSASKELTLLTEQLDSLREQKRGLMQSLLTGQLRVKT